MHDEAPASSSGASSSHSFPSPSTHSARLPANVAGLHADVAAALRSLGFLVSLYAPLPGSAFVATILAQAGEARLVKWGGVGCLVV